MKARRWKTSHNTPGESRKSMFSFSQLRVPTPLRKRRVSVTLMSAWQTYPSNHGTKPKPSPTRYPRSLPPMATATFSAPIPSQYASTTTTSKATSSGKAVAPPSPIMDFKPTVVERDETWVQQLEEEQNQRLEIQARVMHKEYLADLDSAGPFATTDMRQELQRRYEERLEQMKQIQQEELDQHIEMERQERLWSLDQQDPAWDGWNRLYEEQANILANIKRDARRSGLLPSVDEKIRENEREEDDLQRRSEEWQKSENQRVRDRQRWAERTRQTNFNIGERRQRDLAEAQARMAEEHSREEQSTRLTQEARQGAAQLRARTSQAALNAEFETTRRPTPVLSSLSETSSRASVSDSIFSSSPSTADTTASSVINERWRPSDTVPPRPSASRAAPIPVPVQENLRRSASGSFGGPSPPSRSRAAGTSTGIGTQSPSPLSGTPTSSAMHYAKGEDPARPAVWIPPETAREPVRKGSMQFEGTRESAPARKASMLFGASPAPPPSPTLEEPLRRSQTQQPRQTPQAQPQPSNPSAGTPLPQFQSAQARTTPSPQPPLQPPNAPGMRSQPLPQAQPQLQNGPIPMPRQNTYSSQTPPSTSFSTSYTDTKQRQDDASRGFPSYSPSPSNIGSKAAPMNTGTKPTSEVRATPPLSVPPAEEYRAKLRTEYVQGQEQRTEEERRRREQEANERRAEDARRRGAEKRRQEEQAREAERREAELKARKASNSSMRPVPDRPVLEVWTAYESQWAAMASASQLRFRSIPWPVMTPISSPDMLLPIHIAGFILNPQHSQGKARKDRLRDALLRWHPDRFEAKWLKKVVEEERDSVQEGVGLVVRALNDLLSTEGTFAA